MAEKQVLGTFTMGKSTCNFSSNRLIKDYQGSEHDTGKYQKVVIRHIFTGTQFSTAFSTEMSLLGHGTSYCKVWGHEDA